MTRLIVAATPIYGHVAPLRSIAADLARRGHEVTFLTGSTFKSFIETAGIRFVPFGGRSDFDFLDPDSFPLRANVPPGVPQIDFDIRHVFADPIPDQHRTLQALAQAARREHPGEAVVLLHDTVFMGVWPVLLGAQGIRPDAVIGIGVNPLTLRSTDTAPFGLGLAPDNSEEGRARNKHLNALVENEAFAGAQAHLAAVLRSTGTTASPPFIFDGFVSLPDQFLQLSIADLEYHRTDAPDGLRFVGALTPAPSAFEPPPWWARVVEARKVVAVTQGTIANRDLDELIVPTLRAAEDMDVMVVALTGRQDAKVSSIPVNAVVADFVSFEHLMPHVDLMVSNGGYGGVQQALRHGVPLVLAGESEDKIEVNARVAHTGAAINLATSRPDPAALRGAIERVLSEPTYLRHARRLQREFGHHNAFEEIDAAVRSLAHPIDRADR